MVKVEGETYRCECGCNVFTLNDETGIYSCNACPNEFYGEVEAEDPPAKHDEMRAWLQQRIDRVKESPKLTEHLQRRWTTYGAPKWAECTPDNYEDVDQLLADVEAHYELPFIPQPYTHAELPPEPMPRVPPDEGRTFGKAEYEAFRRRMLAEDERDRGQFMNWVDQMTRASVPLNLGMQTTERRLEIARALLAWAAYGGDDEALRAGLAVVLGDDRVQPAFPLGALLGRLEIDEARGLGAEAWTWADARTYGDMAHAVRTPAVRSVASRRA